MVFSGQTGASNKPQKGDDAVVLPCMQRIIMYFPWYPSLCATDLCEIRAVTQEK